MSGDGELIYVKVKGNSGQITTYGDGDNDGHIHAYNGQSISSTGFG
ncbi:MAG: hypothetical protein ACI9QV_000075 [Methylophagaceae bacterium]|jgi:hypothetical protein